MNYTLSDKRNIIFKGEAILKSDHDIVKLIEKDDCAIVLLSEVSMNEKRNCNVVAYNDRGKLLWQVQPLNFYPGGQKDCPFVDILINEKGELVLFNWCSFLLVVDPITGKVINQRETR